MKFDVGDRVKVVLNVAGAAFDDLVGDRGVVAAILPFPNAFTGVYPGVLYRSDGTDRSPVVALEAELEKIES